MCLVTERLTRFLVLMSDLPTQRLRNPSKRVLPLNREFRHVFTRKLFFEQTSSSHQILRAYQWHLIFATLWSFTAIIQAALHPFNVGVASVAGIGAFVVGVVSARSTAKRVEKNGGEYRPSRRRTLFGLGFGFVFGALLFYLLFSEALSLNTLLQFNSVSVAVPGLYFGGAVGFGTWEVRNGKEIQWEGRTFYSVPKGLSWQEQYQYRSEQRNRLRIKNSGEQEPTGEV